ncbi:TolB family protein [Nocardioides sp. SYSU DS0651]|uniref:TolB family protein n=1 Tax=Nocardioides sp. SYSU DS0651 TaxID=3415955 RepID=UPI003F4C78F9
MRNLLVGVLALLTTVGCSSRAEPDEPEPDAPEPPASVAQPAGAPCAAAALDDVTVDDGHELVFTSYREGAGDLWVVRADGTDAVRLTDDALLEITPAWSPDGRRIAFACATGEDAQYDLYVMDADGSRRRRVTATPECEETPRWSPDGARLYFTGGPCGGAHAVAVVDVDGTDRAELAPVGSWPALSPDGRRLLYDVPIEGGTFLETTLWSVGVDGGKPAELGPAGLPAAYESSWSPDGERIAFISPTGDVTAEDPPRWGEDVFVMRVDGTGVRRLTRTPGNDHWPPAWSPDGRFLVYSADGAANEDGVLTRIDVDTGETRALTQPGRHALFADWRD